MSPLARRLAEPARRLTPAALADAWFAVRIVARVRGYGAFADETDLPRKLRGALGAVLLRSASPEARAGQPCPWRPPCALDVLFREQLRLGPRHGVPKPWVLSVGRHAGDLEVRLTLMGFAADWTPALSAALAEALSERVDWRSLRPDLFHPRPEIGALSVIELPAPGGGATPDAVEIRLLSPLDAEGADPREEPATLIGRLARRVSLLARWQDADVEADWPTLAAKWHDLHYAAGDLHRIVVGRRAGRGRHRFGQAMVTGSLVVRGSLGHVWPFLRIGTIVHVGRGATAGFGSISLGGGAGNLGAIPLENSENVLLPID